MLITVATKFRARNFNLPLKCIYCTHILCVVRSTAVFSMTVVKYSMDLDCCEAMITAVTFNV